MAISQKVINVQRPQINGYVIPSAGETMEGT